MNLKERYLNWVHSTRGTVQGRVLLITVMKLNVP